MTETRFTLIHAMTYRGAYEEWATSYTLTGPPPTSAAGWDTLLDAIVAQEKTCYPAAVSIVRAYCYDTDDVHAPNVYARVFTTPVAGTLAIGTGLLMAGNDAVWVRWGIARRNSRGKKIYLRKYLHGAMAASGAQGTPLDTVYSAQRTALLAFGAKLRDGTFAEARTVTASGHVDTVVDHNASTWIGERQLRKGTRRPPP